MIAIGSTVQHNVDTIPDMKKGPIRRPGPATREDIERARAMTGSEKLRAGGDMFDEDCRLALIEIRREHPGISDADALDELRRLIAEQEERENNTVLLDDGAIVDRREMDR